MSEGVLLDLEEAEDLAARACLAAGAGQATARSLVEATMSAALQGSPSVGFPHFIDYLDSLHTGRINPNPSPTLSRPYPAFLLSDADRGIAQLGFDLAFGALVEAAGQFGVAVFSQRNSFTTGELGYYVRRLAERGLASIAATNAHALMAPEAGGKAVYSTNPLALGFPLGNGLPPLVIDQSSSATAFVNIVKAAAEGRPIPPGWAVGRDGGPTVDASEAMAGALLPFGGRKGANLALMVEMLSAGLSGGAWSLDAADFRFGEASPAVGLTVVALMPGAPGDGLVERAGDHMARLRHHGVYVPGVSSERVSRSRPGVVNVPRDAYEKMVELAGGWVSPQV